MDEVDYLGCCFSRVVGCAHRVVHWSPVSASADNAVSRIEIVPEWLKLASSLNEFISWLNIYIKSGLDRKMMLIDWCKENNYQLTKELVARVYKE
jgi:hypothetical protein